MIKSISYTLSTLRYSAFKMKLITFYKPKKNFFVKKFDPIYIFEVPLSEIVSFVEKGILLKFIPKIFKEMKIFRYSESLVVNKSLQSPKVLCAN